MGIFDDKADIFVTYHAAVQFRDKVMGGTPKNPKAIEGWLPDATYLYIPPRAPPARNQAPPDWPSHSRATP